MPPFESIIVDQLFPFFLCFFLFIMLILLLISVVHCATVTPNYQSCKEEKMENECNSNDFYILISLCVDTG